MRRDEGGAFAATLAGGKNHQTERPRGQLSSRRVLFGVLVLVAATAFAGVLLSCAPVTATPTLHTLPLTPTQSGRDGMWHDVGLSANAQIVFSRSAPQVAYSCDVVNKSIVMRVTHDGGMNWQPLVSVTPLAAVSYWKNGFFVSKGSYEFTLVLMTVSTVVGLIGPGRLLLDILFGITLPEAWLFVALAAAALVVDGIGLVVSHPVTPAGARSDEGYRAS